MALDPKRLVDGTSTVEGGQDSGKSPLLLGMNQVSFGGNIALRGGFMHPRPGYTQVPITFPSTVVQGRFESGRWQVAGRYKPDNGPEILLCSIGGRQFRINVTTDNSVQEITISFNTSTSAGFVPPAIGSNVTITVVTTANLAVGSGILVNGKNYTVETIISATQVAIKNVDDDGSTNPVPSGSSVVSYNPNPSTIDQAWEVQAENWWILRDGQSIPFLYNGAISRRAASGIPVASGKEIGPGRMMTYAMGRVWGALTDEFSFRAGDLVYGAYGRDSVIKETENTFLNGGGDFTTPSTAGGITGIRGVATLDTSLGQGPVQVLTPSYTFSVNSPVDRTEWQSLANPIQTVSTILNGGLSHYGSILVNGDLVYRAVDGIRSLILARRDFNSWGNVPFSREMNRILQKDTQNLLKYSSAVVFNNRLFMTCSPFRTSHGVYHRGLVSMDLDLLSALGQKTPPIFDGVHFGLDILQIVSGEFNGTERCFAFVLNAEEEIELYEITKENKFDHQVELGEDIPIHWIIETPSYKFQSGLIPQPKVLKQLNGLELEIGELTGEVTFNVYWKPDSYPCWLHWKTFTECAAYKSCDIDPITGCQTIKNYKPQFRPRLVIGVPPNTCDSITNRPLRHGYSFQVRLEIDGYCEIRGLSVIAEQRDESYYGERVQCE